MKVSLFSNDKSTAKDELILTIILVVTAIVGILLTVFKPHIGIINSNLSTIVGAMMIIIVVILSPIIIYRLMENVYDNKNKNAGESKNE